MDELGSIRGLIEDATRDTTLWLQADPSAEERAHVLAMQERLASLDRIVARRMERRVSLKDNWEWSEAARDVLSLLEKAKQVRGNIVGKGLARLPDHLPTKLPGMKLPEPMEPVNTSLRSLIAVTGKASGKNQEEKQPTQLPANLQHAGDPVDGNPFPADDLRHKVWKDATLKAEEEACRVNSEFLKQSPAGQQGFVEWVQQGKMASATQYFASWTIALCVAKFDIWAKRGIHVVWSEAAVKAYDQWLCNYAQSWLNAQEKLDNLSHSALIDLRSRLVERVEHWKAEARRYLSEQRKSLEQSEPVNSTGVDRLRTNANQTEPSSAQNSMNSAPNAESKTADAAADPPPNDEKVKHGNAVVEFGDVLTAVGGGHGTWVSVARGNGVKDESVARMTKASLKALLKQKGLTTHGWATQAGVDFHTADDYLKSETKPYPDTLKKLADALDVKVELLPE
jgi:lambda repressor-like predicted transcriptional regulator